MLGSVQGGLMSFFLLVSIDMADTNDKQQNMVARQPVVVVMGHVDHGKTTLLDYIRKARVADKEAGGITQAVGAYEIEHNGKKITFIDTPGHEAFYKMRSRGANIADLAILVVAAEEGVKPQTKEVINILEQTKTPFIVAINKVDKPGADIERTKTDLMMNGVYLEGSGGQTSYETISAKSGLNVDKLLDLILLTAEVEGFKADISTAGEGYVLETRMTKSRGLEATVIVKNGTLKRGDEIATHTAKGKAKILENFLGKAITEAVAGAPAIIVGFEEMPQVGEEFLSGAEAHAFYSKESLVERKENLPSTTESSDGLVLLLKSSDAGSLEVLSEIIRSLPLGKPIKIVSESVGEISEGDVKLAISSGATIIGFKVKAEKSSVFLAGNQEVNIVTSEIIYELVKAVEDLFKKKEEGKLVGELNVLAVFNQSKLDKQLVGGKVSAGLFKNKAQLEIWRSETKIGEGRIVSMQMGKKDAVSVPEGNECGVVVGSAVAIAVGDRLVIREKE